MYPATRSVPENIVDENIFFAKADAPRALWYNSKAWNVTSDGSGPKDAHEHALHNILLHSISWLILYAMNYPVPNFVSIAFKWT